ncbi:nitroreductase family protein [Allomuricauda sp. NBRC 101325]|uniref:nitroreductase family protein n=1 Tax=Allomuricauda sp. NBRC 101325 TaxID=1113758 RepID=UPI0024A25AFB|nr:nitroreductase family protein [Muricauda sp. NBRC 101325]GLU43209.1 hypothetical protein Musp01_08330 [Muricauda sp. NBRC 101325]
MKRILKTIKNFVKIWIYSAYDFIKVVCFSNMVYKRTNKEALRSRIMINLHRIEKGLTYANFKPYFGLYFFDNLIKDLNTLKGAFGENTFPYFEGISALEAYKNRHVELGYEVDRFPFDKFPNTDVKFNNVGAKKVSDFTSDFHQMVYLRSSVRNFDGPADPKLIEESVQMAINTPSVCNRQPWKVYFFSQKDKVQELLKFQNGNRGFSDTIESLIIVTGNLSEMEFSIERHQIFIDGGLFSMSLIYSLFSKGVSSCCLNWCTSPINDYKAHKVTNIPFNEEIIMYIAVGTSSKDINVTCSPKKLLDDVLINEV